MVVLVCYDVRTITAAGRKRLRKVAKICEGYGTRVQYSIFECPLEPKRWIELKYKLLAAYDEHEDSLRFYYIDEGSAGKTEHSGVRIPLDLEGPLVV
jgi:CRISPR-associated protein Cas2